MKSKKINWVSNQWTSAGIIVKDVPPAILNRAPRLTYGGLGNTRELRSSNQQVFSGKLHNAFNIKAVDYRSPPQVAAMAFEVTDDMTMTAEVLGSILMQSNSVHSILAP
ncbi:hypothetical protein LY76DRAFT_688042 [Colletotrichum caudatum]|nr:hypothetical protein LY76DRAFT_688042 [Colletotrichum caudatum]